MHSYAFTNMQYVDISLGQCIKTFFGWAEGNVDKWINVSYVENNNLWQAGVASSTQLWYFLFYGWVHLGWDNDN